jgi:hypothetical protein
MYVSQKLDLRGYHEEPVPHTFFRQQGGSQHMALIFAGQANTCQHPTLYYSTRELLHRGADALLVDYGLRPTFSSLSTEERLSCVQADAIAAYGALFAEYLYQQVTLVGKSLGTLTMSYLLAALAPVPQVRAIWLTPLLKRQEVQAALKQSQPRSLFIVGTADSHYDAAVLAELEHITRGTTLAIPAADHLLEVPEGTIASLRVMEQIMGAITTFLDEQ